MHRSYSTRRYRRAFSLVELLVAISIIGILVALSLPAIQSIREASRRTSCINNQRQIGIALNDYLSSRRHYPVGCVEWRPFGDTVNRQLAWSAFLLPWLEAENVHRKLNLDLPFDHIENATAASTVLPVFVCPSGLQFQGADSDLGPSDYGGIFGERISGPNNPPKGVMLHDITVTSRQIRDGLSKTLIISEDATSPDGQWINGRNLFDQAFGINSAPDFENDIRSEHPSGAVACFCDGHVQFLNDQLDLEILAALCTRAGGEVVSFDF